MEIPFEKLNPETLQSLVESFVTREGTDYGLKTWSIEQKVEQVLRQIRTGKAKITFDPESETCNIQAVEQILNSID